jgi:hypothetical protein
VSIANDEGDLGRILNPDNNAAGLNRMNQRVNNATAFGYERSAFEKKNYQLRHLNEGAVDQALRSAGVAPTATTAAARRAAATSAQIAAAERAADISQLRTSMPQMSTGDLGRINVSHVDRTAHPDNYRFVRENFTPHMIEQLQMAPPALKMAMVGHLTRLHIDAVAARGAGNQGEANRLQKQYDAIDLYCR